MEKYHLRYYQRDAVTSLLNAIRQAKDGLLVALPTGSGKTIVIAEFINQILQRNPNANFIVLSHVQEILMQNYNTLTRFLDVDIGINSASIGRRENDAQVLIAGIQSVYKTDLASKFRYIIIDEAHTIPPNSQSMYQQFLKHKEGRLIGLTATPYRLGSGYIYGKDKIFKHLVCDYSSGDNFVKLIEDGYLSPVYTKDPETIMDTSGIKQSAGDFNLKELGERFDTSDITERIVLDLIEKGKDRKKWLIFAIDIEHAEYITSILNRNNIPSACVHSKMQQSRDEIISDFKNGKYRCLVNVNILTTGFDVPDIDLLGLLRPTMSPVLHVQMVGRGMRIAPGKTGCLVLDYAGNTNRLGPINQIKPKEKGKGKCKKITKTCPKCREIVHLSARYCPQCGYEFPRIPKLSPESFDSDIIVSNKPKWLKVDKWKASRYKKIGMPDSVLIQFECGPNIVKKWITIEHKGYAKYMAHFWVKNHLVENIQIRNCDEMLDAFEKGLLRMPKEILVKRNGPFLEIVNEKF